MDDINLITLPNGIRVAHREVNHTKTVHCGFILDIGSRDEREDQQGIAHFLEHMAFKGTTSRKAYHIINRLESVGGELNAYTTKEKIYFYASTLDKHFDRSFELLTDITFHSSFPEREIEKEKGVILEEMAMYLDAPEDAIVDEFDEVIFKEHSLGYNILGTQETVRGFGQQDFREFLDEHLNSKGIIISIVGNVTEKEVVAAANKYLSELPQFNGTVTRSSQFDFEPTAIQKSKRIQQAHCMIGRDSFALGNEKRMPFLVLNHLFGGPGMTSRLNMNLREKNGLVYTVESNYAAYKDTGLFNIYFGTEKKQLNRSKKLVFAEMKKLREKELGKVQLASIKEQICGQLAMAEESNVGMMQMMGKSLLDLGRIDTLSSIFDQINDVSAKQLQDLANEMFIEDQLSELTYIPE